MTPEDARRQTAEPGHGLPTETQVQRFTPLPTGSRLGDLTVQSVLGAGEFGITYIAVPDGATKRFVVKEYLPRAIAFRDGLTVRVSSANAPVFATGLDRFLTEARTLAKLRHTSVIQVLSVYEANGTGYCVMPHEVGRDLGIWLHELRRPPTQVELDKLVEPLLDGLATLHAKGVHHLDISAGSILVRESGTPVLLDFGSSRAALRRRMNIGPPQDALPYMAPELVAGDQALIGARSDIYAVSAVLYQLATGTVPVEASRRMLRDELPPIYDTARGKLRHGFLEAVDAGLRYRPDDRPHDVAPWKDELLRHEGAQPKATAVMAQLDQAEAEATPGAPATTDPADVGTTEQLMDNPAFRPLFFGLAGAVCGALAGALSSFIVAGVVWSSCAADSCIAPVLPYTAALGTMFGLIAGARYGRKTAVSTDKPLQNTEEF